MSRVLHLCPPAAFVAAAIATAAGAVCPPPLAAQTARVADLTVRAGAVPRRLVGYGLVVGLDGTGDRSFGGFANQTPTVRSVVNLLQRFGVQVPPEHLQARNVAAVLVTAELSPYLRAGGRFEVQVSSLGDATSLRGGVLWVTPLVADPNEPPVATAQGPLLTSGDGGAARTATTVRRANSGRIPDGGLLEVDPPAGAMALPPRLVLRRPDLATATRIAGAINAAYGPGLARVDDPGAVTLMLGVDAADTVMSLLAAIDTLPVATPAPARIMIDAREGTVVAGGELRVGPASVSHRGLTLSIGAPPSSAADSTLLALAEGATVHDVVAGLHAAGATAQELGAIFEALRQVGALTAEVTIR